MGRSFYFYSEGQILDSTDFDTNSKMEYARSLIKKLHPAYEFRAIWWCEYFSALVGC